MKMFMEDAEGFLLSKKEVDEKIKKLINFDGGLIVFPEYPYGDFIEIKGITNNPYRKVRDGVFEVTKKEEKKFIIHYKILKDLLALDFPEKDFDSDMLGMHLLLKKHGKYYHVCEDLLSLNETENFFYHFSLIHSDCVDIDEEPPIERITGKLRKYALSKMDDTIAEDELKQMMLDSDLMNELTDEIIKMLKRTGDIFEPKEGVLRRI